MTEAFEWDRRTILYLIETYRNYEVLWNPKHIHHHDKQIRQNALNEIAYHLNIDQSEIVKQFKKVSRRYERELEKKRHFERPNPPFKSEWFAYEAMEFMPPRLIRKSFDTRLCDFFVNFGKEEASQNSDKTTTEQTPLYEYTPKRKRTQADDTSTERFEQSPLKAVSSWDECSTFSEYVASKLKTMEKKTKAMVEYEINLILFKADMGFYTDKKCDEIERLDV